MGKSIARNKKAYFDYEIEEKFEAGIVLKGSEVKAARAGKVNIKDSFVKIVKNEAFLFNAHISLLETTNYYYAHEERGARKLLLHRKQINKMFKKVTAEGYTIVALELYFNDRNRVKIQIGIAKGKKLYDKRESLKAKTMARDASRAMKEY